MSEESVATVTADTPAGPAGPVVPGPLHFNGSARPAAVKPAQQPAEEPAAKIAAFDAEMVSKGVQMPPRAPDGKFVDKSSVADVDDRMVDALNAAYRALTPEERQAKRPLYERELAEAYQGRQLGENRGQFLARTTPAVTSPTPQQMNYNAALERAVAAQDGKGVIDHTAIGPELTHGYALPPGKYMDLKDLVDGLKIARNRGWTQAQVEKILRETAA